MTGAVTGVSSPEPPDPPEPPDLTSAFTIPSIPVCFLVLSLTISDLDLKIQTFRKIDLSSQIFKEIFLSKDFGLIILIVVFIRFLTAVCRSFFITSYPSITQFHSVSHRSLPLMLHVAVSLCCSTPSYAAIAHCVKNTEAHPSSTFIISATTRSRSLTSLEPLSFLLDTSLQVIDLKLSVCILLASMISFECCLVPGYDTLASVRLSAVCSLCSGLTPVNDSLKLFPHRLWQNRSSVPKIMYASMFVLLKGSSIWCVVASVCDAELLIVKSASVADSISGVRPVLVLSNSQSLISLLNTIGVEFRGLLSDIRCCLCVMFAPILWCCISLLCFTMVAADVLAGLALLLLDVNNLSSYGD